MSKLTARNFRPTLKPIAQAVGLSLVVIAGLAPIHSALAGAGWVERTLSDGSTDHLLQTFNANSPSGVRTTAVPEGVTLGTGQDTGTAMRKFVDPLPLVGAANAKPLSGDAAAIKYIPKAVVSKWVKPDGSASTDDYFEIAVVEYSEKFHSDLAKATTLRGYVQIDHLASNGRGLLPGSNAVALTYPNGSPIMIAGTDANGKLTGVKVPALAVDKPHYLGPMLSGTTGVPTRLKFHNLLPIGRAEITSGAGTPDAVVGARNGDMFLPVDKSILGAGYGPDGVTVYTQNRANVHLHGGDNPWISDGTPHQWITPAGEADATDPKALAGVYAADTTGTYDPELLPQFLRGVSNFNVPDMYDPGPGASTYYYPNGQSARFLWIHDQTAGITRLNHYAGMVAPYELTDATEQALIADNTLPSADRTIPLIIEDKTFVPKDIKLQDGRWNTSAWGAEGDLWFSHVYESLQDPAQLHGTNNVGRWYYGPLFWPIFPAMYDLPTGAYGDETITPESYLDTPVINGVAYPTLEVDPGTYRFKVLNASVDRHITINLFEGKTAATLADGTPVTNLLGIASEVDMVQATQPLPEDACADTATRSTLNTTTGKYCYPAHWPMDSRAGGVVAPSAAGPTMYQIANEGGWLPAVAPIDPSPTLYNNDKGRITIFNVEGPALVLTPAERADLVIDFAAYAGKTLILYNDAGAPEPGSDPRNNYFTGAEDQSGTGGAESTKAGYGPNMRTMMQIKVRATPLAPVTPLNLANLETKVANAYVATQPKPLVAQPAYAGFDSTWAGLSPTQSYATIFTATLKEPTFKFTPGTPSAAFNSIKVVNEGTGYLKSPAITITPSDGQGTGATALATMKIDHLTVTNPGSGYITAPTVTIVANAGGGTGAMADARLAPNAMTVTNGGSGYATAPTVNFPFPPTGATKPQAHAVVAGGKVTEVIVDVPGTGYAAVPFPTFTGGGGTGASATMTAGIDAVHLFSPYPTSPGAVGGGGYTDFTQVAINLVGGSGTGAAVTASGRLFDISVTNEGTGYTAPPVITVGAPELPGGVLATAEVDRANNGAAQGSLLAQAKAVQELHDANYGRYNNTLGIELPFTGAFNQTTIPLGYIDTASEIVTDNETQLWKFTHNGLFNQAVHFRMFNVQLINRVGWDNFGVPPSPSELGWKDTVRINPLEDTIVALKPKKPVLPGFGLPLSVRPADPTQPLGSPFGFTQIDPATGNPAPVVNDMVDYGWEYAVQDTILSRAENDFIRPMIFHAKEAVPAAPSATDAVLTAGVVNVSWADNATTEYKFEIWRADKLVNVDPLDVTVNLGPFELIGTALANGSGFADTNPVNLSGGDALAYQVVAVGGNGTAPSPIAITPLQPGAPFAPVSMTAVAQSDTAVLVAWQDQASNELGFFIERNVNGTGWNPIGATTVVGNNGTVDLLRNLPANTLSLIDTGLAAGDAVQYRIKAVNTEDYSAEATASATTLAVPAMTAVLAATDSWSQVTLTWPAPVLAGGQVISSYQIVRTGGAGPAVTYAAPANAVNFVDSGLEQFTAYSYTVRPMNGLGAAPLYGTASTATATTYYAPVTMGTLSAVSTSPTNATLSWTGGVPATSYLVERCEYSAANFDCTSSTSVWTPAVTVPAPASGYIDSTVNGNVTYAYKVTATNGVVGATTAPNVSNTLQTSVLTLGGVLVAPPTNLTAVLSFSLQRVDLTWIDRATNETSFIIERSVDGVNFSQIGVAAPRTGTTGRTRTFSDSSVAQGNTYYYRVRAQNLNGTIVSNSMPSTPPVKVDYFLTAPTGLTAAISSTTRVNLSWTDASTTETAFAVWRSSVDALGVATPAIQIGRVTRSTTQGNAVGGALVTYSDQINFVVGSTYTYYVTATNGPGASAPSNTTSVSFVPPADPAPLGVSFVITSGSRANVTLAIPAATPGVTYTVQRIRPASAGGGTSTLLTNTTATAFTDNNVRRSTAPYIYQIRANSGGLSSVYVQTSIVIN